MKKALCLLTCLLVFTITITAQTLSTMEAKRIGLPNGWSLTPVGKSLPLGDLPLNIAVFSFKKINSSYQ